MRTGTSFEAGCFQTSVELGRPGLFQEKSFGSVCTAATLVQFLAIFKYGVYKISSFFERVCLGSTNIHFPARESDVVICRAFWLRVLERDSVRLKKGLCRLHRSSSSLDRRVSHTSRSLQLVRYLF